MKVNGLVKNVLSIDEVEAKDSLLGYAFLKCINLAGKITGKDNVPYKLEIEINKGSTLTALFMGSNTSPPNVGDIVNGTAKDISDHPGNKGANIELEKAKFTKPETDIAHLLND